MNVASLPKPSPLSPSTKTRQPLAHNRPKITTEIVHDEA